MEINKKEKDKIPYKLSIEKYLKTNNNNKNKELENLFQEISNINKNILRYNKLENLIKSEGTYEEEKDIDFLYYQKSIDKKKQNINIKNSEKKQLFGDLKHLCNKVYTPRKTVTEKGINTNNTINNLKLYKNNVKYLMDNIFKNNDNKTRNGLFPLIKKKTKDNSINNNKLIKSNLNISNNLLTEPNYNINNISPLRTKLMTNSEIDKRINNYNISNNDYYQYMYNEDNDLPKTVETNKRRINVSFGNYATNNVKYNHPQLYVLNSYVSPVKKKLPPINNNYGRNINTVDLLRKNNSSFDSLLKKNQNKYEKYVISKKIEEILKSKEKKNNNFFDI